MRSDRHAPDRHAPDRRLPVPALTAPTPVPPHMTKPVATRVGLAVLAAATLAAAACSSDSATGPGASSAITSTTTTTLTALKSLQRTTPLASDIVVSAVIGSGGGQIKIQDAGFTLVVPAGAVKVPTTFSVKAFKGYAVAYSFQPAGAKFPGSGLQVTQMLQSTNWFKLKDTNKSEVGYFADDSLLDPVKGIGKVSEIVARKVDVKTAKMTFDIKHFSGYMVSSGRACDPGQADPLCDNGNSGDFPVDFRVVRPR